MKTTPIGFRPPERPSRFARLVTSDEDGNETDSSAELRLFRPARLVTSDEHGNETDSSAELRPFRPVLRTRHAAIAVEVFIREVHHG